ncbi:cilia- and flagella-associated protein 47 [Sorex fumeus]|uniref:cilia- and flagella-associated protein 47 n=1 Tax=Sorex fumeus TaxID=62283 RepID=UPI0024AE49BB|nr:cilia- and flagella-associated protein 47 [Sorex fumeus]
MDLEKSSFISRDNDTAKKDLQLRVYPSELRFVDAVAGKVYRLSVTLHNVGRSNQKIRFQEPNKPQFKLVMSTLDKPLASGLQLTAVVEYHPDKNEDNYDELVIYIGTKTLTIPLIGLIPTCQLQVEQVVDFGKLVANSKVYSKEVSVFNNGKYPGTFLAEYVGFLPIVISPTNGTVMPKSSMSIKVDLCTSKAQVVNEVVKMSLQGQPDILINIRAHIVNQVIEVLNITTGKKIKCIDFSFVYFGTSKLEYAHLHNDSPEAITWVAILQDDTVGEEVATNIRQRTDVALNNLSYLTKIRNIDVSNFITCIPNEGKLQPYEKVQLTFCFSPKLLTDDTKNFDPAHRQDYALFLRFECVGSRDGYLRNDINKEIRSDEYNRVELALTGTGLPVVLQFIPGKVFTFQPCLIGGHSDMICTMHNHSRSLPVSYQFKKAAHFKINPKKGKIDEGCNQVVTCSFIPHQIGIFKVKQVIEIIGLVANEDFQSTTLKPFHEMHLYFNSVCKPYTKEVVMSVNPGLSPLVSNPTVQYVTKDVVNRKEATRAAMLQSALTPIHDHRSAKENSKDALIAFPNDRAGSIRPGDHKNFRTIFTKTPRYSYVDPEFEYTDIEKLEKGLHKNYYARYINYLRNLRIQKQAEREFIRSHSITEREIPPDSGVKSPDHSGAEIPEETQLIDLWPKPNQMLTTKNIIAKVTKSLKRKIMQGIKSEPSTPIEKHHCSIILTPKQIHQVIIGPSVLNFGEVCVHSINSQVINIINMLSVHVLIDFDIQFKELEKSKQFSFVIPPIACTYISMLFHSTTVGKFWKSFTFNLNGKPTGHILVMAVVHPVRLELSYNDIVLKSQGFLMKSCFRKTVSLYNPNNYFAQFEWEPVKKKGMAFFINPVKGIVEPHSSLECEVTWSPGFSSLEKGEMILHVPEGNTTKLKCTVEPGQSKVMYLEPRVIFSHAPQGLTSWRTAVLHNVGPNHAYYRICDEGLSPIIKIVPTEGIIPFGGLSVLNISCTPTEAGNFDTKAKVAIHGANIITLRIGGTVDIADVEIEPSVLKFLGTYIGSTNIFPILIINKGVTRARVSFNMEEHKDFSVSFADKSVQISDPESPDVYFLELDGQTSLECGIVFSPKEVAVHKFQLHVLVNNFNASELYCQHLLENTPLTQKKTPLIKPFFIQATALQAPLTFSKNSIGFEIPLDDLESENNCKRSEELVMHNVSKKTVRWTFSSSQTGNLFLDPVFKCSKLNGVLLPGEECKVTIVFQPTCDKEYIVDIPVLLNDNPVCYRTLRMIGEVKSPKLSFDPPHVFFTPVPLDVRIGLDIIISPKNHFKNTSIRVFVPKVKGPDGEELRPISVRFPSGSLIEGSPSGINSPLTCRLAFKSSKSVSLFSNVRFSSMAHRWFSLPVSATAENCILTIYPYMALHIDEQKIVLKDDDIASVLNADLSLLYKDEFVSPDPSKCAVSSVPTTGRKLSLGMEVTYERNKFLRRQSVKKDDDGTMETEEENKQFFFPDEGTKAYTFFHKIVNATQTWFSLFGWPGGPHSLSIPETVRRDLYKLQFCSSIPSENYSCQDNFSKFNKTIYDVIIYLSGKVPPGINSDQSLPADRVERVIQLYSQHSSLLKFLKAHGAYISHVLPEFLFEPDDYTLWIKLMSSSYSNSENCLTSEEPLSVVVDKAKFEVWSKRAWTDVFLQIYKIMILSRIEPHKSKDLPPISVKSSPKLNPCFISSNMYSNSERLLLSWMNTNYENARQIIWKNCPRGVAPCERWIINFDTDLSDGLVLGTQFGAYCPFLIDSYLVNMYTHPKSPEQYLHNCLIIVNVLHEVGFEMDIQATDICDPNPIMMLMLCAYMYERLPTYIPKKTVLFNCSLHETTVRQILIKNPSLNQLVYTAMIVGRDAADFHLTQKQDTFVVAPRGQIEVSVEFTSRFLHPAEALLLLVSKTKHVEGGSTLTFALKGELLQFKTADIIKCISPCYTWKEVTLNIKNPFRSAGEFRVILLESSTFISLPSQLLESKRLLNRMEDEDNTSCDRDVSEGCVPNVGSLKTSIKCNFVREFFCSESTFNLSLKGSSLKLFFLPFAMHLRYCIIILSNRKIGEIVYILEGRGSVPLPSYFPSMISPFQTDHKDTSDEGPSNKDPVLYLKCKLGEVLCTNLNFPLINDAKEKAFAFAAQQQMSKMEYDRREITGTLESSSVRVAVALLGLTKLECCTFFTTSQIKRPKTILYSVEISLPEFFHVPDKIYIPQIPESRTKHSELHGMKLEHKSEPDASIAVPLRFFPLESGRYPCKVLLKSKYDVRFYLIEGVVDEQWVEGRFEFITRAFKALTQHIPIANTTNKEWKCRAEIQGDWFYGPPIIYIGPNKKTSYPLTFKPILECEILGKLTLVNIADTMKHIFQIRGIGKPPLAIENIALDCPVGIDTKRTIMVPNHTKSILTYKVTSDLSIVWGSPAITVQPDNLVPYVIHINPWKRGHYKGMITFTVLSKQEIDLQEQLQQKQRKDSVVPREHRRGSVYRRRVSLIPTVFNKPPTDDSLKNLRVWFCIDINSTPGLPTDIFEIQGTALEPLFVEIPLHNTQDKILHIDVLLSPALSGMKEVDLSPLENSSYSLQITTAVAGSCEEKIVFQPENSFEFWYLLRLTTDSPKPTTISELQCEIGKYISQNITLNNPTHQELELKGRSTNPINFILNLSELSQLVIPPFSSMEVSFNYYPSTLGKNDQQGSIIFSCSQFKEWVFNVSGMGLYPVSLNIERVSTYIRLPKYVLIQFQNPTMEEVIVDITLTNEETPENFIIDDFWNDFFERTSVFILSDDLPKPHETRLPPRGKLNIPVLFIPNTMRLYKTIVIIQMKRVNGELWPIDHFDEMNPELKQLISIFDEKVPIIHWLYPIIGLPEARNPTYPLDGKEIREFEYEIEFESEEKKKLLESCVAVYMLDKAYNVDTEEITVIFSLVFAPRRPLRAKISLTIQCATDGIWRYPMLLVAKQPNPDGIINIEGVGLNKEAYLEFYLTTASRDPEPFVAQLRPKSDPEFFITPQEGELRPHGSDRAIFRVGFKPQRYGKPYKAELVIQTENMYWLYAVYGVIPTSAPSKDVKAKVDCRRMSTCKRKCMHNYVYENTRLFKTGLSSKTKNAPLTWKNK